MADLILGSEIPKNCPKCGAPQYHKRKGIVYYKCDSRAGNYELNPPRWFNQSCGCALKLTKAQLAALTQENANLEAALAMKVETIEILTKKINLYENLYEKAGHVWDAWESGTILDSYMAEMSDALGDLSISQEPEQQAAP